jgi:hypothetical protein
MDWSREEVEAIVADYLQMLSLELGGQRYNKTEHRRRLQRQLVHRTGGSIEFKHCNISAALIELGFPYISGYQPRSNYQALLAEVVAERVEAMKGLDDIARAAVDLPAIAPSALNFSRVKTEAPVRRHRASEAEFPSELKAYKRDYLAREAANRSLGFAGEAFVVEYEHWRLVELGQPKLADRVQHVSLSLGDGLGYDVLSFETDGQERFIEVKTTTFGKDTPFFVSRGELSLSKQVKEQFHLYRLFEFRKEPRLFDLAGQLDQHCVLDPVTYRASFA